MNLNGWQQRLWVVFAAALAATSLSAFAQSMEEAQISAQPLVYMKQGKLEGCGIRFIGVLLAPNLKTGRGLDTSVNIWTTGMAAAKGLSYDIDVAALRAGGKTNRAPINSFWIKAPDSNATSPLEGRINDSDDAGGKIYLIAFDSALPIFRAVIEEKSLMFGVGRQNETGEKIYFGVAKLSKAELEQITQCLREMVK